MTPFFSVIVATYNRAELLRECVRSALDQRFDAAEIIVVDDGSTDDTAAVLAAFGDRIAVIRQENRGPGAARNAAAARARGRYLAILDSDDLFFPWTLSTYHEVIASNSEPAFVTGTPVIFSGGDAPAAAAPTPLRSDTFADYYASADKWRWYGGSSFVVRADVFQRVGGFTNRWINGEDADLAMRLGVERGFVHVTSPQTFAYREHSNSAVANSQRTLDGTWYGIRAEHDGRYPGGSTRARERRMILTRQSRPVMLTCAREHRFSEAWRLYRSTWSWHLALGRVRFLMGFPLQLLLATVRPAPRTI